MKLFHVADIHLGKRRLDGRLPDEDFATAFETVAVEAIAQKAEVFLIAGDLFDKPQVEPPHLRQAQRVLFKLKQAGIPVVAIEGNHDRAFVHSENPTWLHYLSEDGLLILLRTWFNKEGPVLNPWTEKSGGSWLDLGGVRFVGAGYYGAATPFKVRQVAKVLEPGRTHVLMLHAGHENFVGQGGGFSEGDLTAIRDKVCYLALGHVHKPMLQAVGDEWACNPGSPENCDLREAQYEGPRGYAVVEIDPARRNKPVSVKIHESRRRPCLRVEVDCTPFGNKLKNGLQALVTEATERIRAKLPSQETVVSLELHGNLNLDRINLDTKTTGEEIAQSAGVFAVALISTGLNVDGPRATQEQLTLSREEFEKGAIRDLVNDAELWSLTSGEDKEKFTDLLFRLKESVHAGNKSPALVDLIGRDPLVQLIQDAREKEAAESTPELML